MNFSLLFASINNVKAAIIKSQWEILRRATWYGCHGAEGYRQWNKFDGLIPNFSLI